MAAIELQSLAHAYSPSPAEEDDWAIRPHLSHRWEDGGAYALLGPSGCGKTTLLNIMSGLVSPRQGSVLFDGEDVGGRPPEQRNIAQVFQFPVVYDTMTARDNLAFPLKNRGVADSDIRARVAEIAELLEIGDALDCRANSLSADVKQKVALGRGLARADVSAILFDEPLTMIDPQIKWRLRANLKRLRRRVNFTMIYVTHDQTEALTFADAIAVMHQGRILQIGGPAELFERPRHVFVGYFIGSPGMNIMPCNIDGGGVFVGGERIMDAPPGAAGGKTELGVRPEFVRFADDGMAAAVLQARDLGRRRVLDIAVAGREIKMSLAEGEAVPSHPRVVFEPSRTFLYVDGWLAEEGGR